MIGQINFPPNVVIAKSCEKNQLKMSNEDSNDSLWAPYQPKNISCVQKCNKNVVFLIFTNQKPEKILLSTLI